MSSQIKRAKYLGDDVTVWLSQVNEMSPVIFPLWPVDYPTYVPVGLTDDGELKIPTSRLAMLEARHPGRLWFCRVKLSELVANTDAHASWFSKEQ